jgi:hypothetical protein
MDRSIVGADLLHWVFLSWEKLTNRTGWFSIWADSCARRIIHDLLLLLLHLLSHFEFLFLSEVNDLFVLDHGSWLTRRLLIFVRTATFSSTACFTSTSAFLLCQLLQIGIDQELISTDRVLRVVHLIDRGVIVTKARCVDWLPQSLMLLLSSILLRRMGSLRSGL